MKPTESIFLVDGHALAYRAYFAFIRAPLINSRGENTSAAFGFANMLLALLKKYDPRYLAVVFDSGEETDRHREYEEYKAQRAEMPDDMVSQLPWIFEVTKALGIHSIIRPGVEADDLIATIARREAAAGREAVIVTGDKDFLQLLSDRIRVIRPEKGTSLEEEAGPEYCRERFGVGPERIVDLLSLMGDTSDNIPGVKGIGEKTAVKLLSEFGSLDNLYAHLDDVKSESLREKLRAGRKDALMSRDLVTLREVKVDVPIEQMAVSPPDPKTVMDLFLRLEFHQLLKEMALASPEDEAKRDYRLVKPEDLDSLAHTLGEAKELVLDVETTSVDPLEAELVGISFSVEEGSAWYVPVAASSAPAPAGGLFEALDEPSSAGNSAGADGAGGAPQAAGRGIPIESVRAALGPVLANAAIPKIGHNLKYDLQVLDRHGLPVAGEPFDTMIASYCLDPERRSHGLDNLALEFTRHRKIPYQELFAKGDRKRDIRTVPPEKLAEYSSEDADYTMRLKKIFETNMRSLGFEKLFREVEMPLCLVLMRMEREGVGIDSKALDELSARLATDIDRLAGEIYAAAGEEFNIGSPKQLQKVLFEKLKLRAGRRTKTGYSTDEDTLLELATANPIARLIVEHRQLSKLRSTYADALPRLVHARTGRIHTSFNQTVTATGRLSSSDPNLQNIPIRTELGRMIRAAFIPRRGNILMDADYSQIELRIMAHLSKDKGFVAAFHEGADIHTRTAARIYGVAEGAVTPAQRASAKTINFGVIYGMGPRGLSRQLSIPLEEAEKFIAEYFEQYPGVKEYIDRSIAEARKRRYAETLLGRRRLLPEIESEDSMTRGFSERIAVNTPLQGTAADLIKVAMVRIDGEILSRRLRSRMILTVHDELVFDVDPNERAEIEALVRDKMESALALDVPLRVDIGAGANWLEAHS